MPRHNTTTVVIQIFQNGQAIGWLQWRNIGGSLCKEEEAAEQVTKEYYWIGAEENIGMLVSLEMTSFIYPSLKDKLGIYPINCHIHAMAGNCSASFQILCNLLRVASTMTENSPLDLIKLLQSFHGSLNMLMFSSTPIQ